MSVRSISTVLSVAFLALFLSGCASFGVAMKEWLGGKPVEAESPVVAFSEKPNHGDGVHRDYRRMTADRMREESQLGAQSGSLWTMEGQGAYLFAQNKSRLIGDILNVNIDGYPAEQIQAKTKVIKDLLDQLRKQDQARTLASTQEGAEPAEQTAAAAQPAQEAPEQETGPVQLVTTRITEILKDGSYRVEGSKPFLIGSREYTLLVKGIVRAEDFNERGMSAENLLDPNFDIVAARRN